MNNKNEVKCRVEKMMIPTYPEPAKEKLPMYCENRCHQRTSGRVYPNPIVQDVIRDRRENVEHTAIILENDYIELIILPEIGGRIFGAKDKTNGYDFFYRQHVIKPALIGMLGSWLSGGAEFNWPMHHRPSTYLPTDYFIENGEDGSVTVWLSEHEPMDRMKGMVGIKLYKDKAMFETRAQVFNRTELPQSFLWWENIAVPVNENYQVFFPQDVSHVHFHRKQSVATYPIADSCMFNGKDYREGGKDIRQHKNTIEPTSYFSAQSNYSFFGGYDNGKNSGVIHVANRHISPGKKLFTWGYDRLGQCWENALTDEDGSYAELMAGVYSDNQPDFAWLEVGEEKRFVQTWYPFKQLGEPLNANTKLAFNFSADEGAIQVYAVESFENATVEISLGESVIDTITTNLPIGKMTVIEACCLKQHSCEEVEIKIYDAAGKELISFCRRDLELSDVPEPRPVDPSPDELDNPDELFLVGLHMKQYRDALTKPDVYWLRAIELNPLHHQSLNALGLSALKEFRLKDAQAYFEKAIAILTKYNPNPRDGEALYNLACTLKYQGKLTQSYDTFSKATWNYRWRGPAHYALATIDCIWGNHETAKQHLLQSLEAYSGNLKARDLLAVVERKLGNSTTDLVAETLQRDPLDYWALNEAGEDFFKQMASDPSQTILDIALEYRSAGAYDDLAKLLLKFVDYFDTPSPMIYYFLGDTLEKLDQNEKADAFYNQAKNCCCDYCFPSRLEEMQILQHAVDTRQDPRAAYLLGTLLYGKEQYEEAFSRWQYALDGGESYYALYRNLSMGCYNDRNDNDEAIRFMLQAIKAKPNDPQLLFEYNHLLRLVGASSAERITLLENNHELTTRDDLQVELARAYNEEGLCEKALDSLEKHTFVPCEGGEHAIVEQYMFAHFKLGRQALANEEYDQALEHFRQGRAYPENLGASTWDISVELPCIYYEAKTLEHIDKEKATSAYKALAEMGTDFFTYMYQPATDCYRAMAIMKLGDTEKGESMLKQCIDEWECKIKEKDYGYFKSTPFFLSFLEKPNEVRKTHYNYLIGLAHLCLSEPEKASEFFTKTIEITPGHLMANLELCEL